MLRLGIVCLMTAIAAAAPDEPGPPEARGRKLQAAEKAREAGRTVEAEVLLLEVVADAERLGRDDPRLATELERLAYFYLDRRRKRPEAAEPLIRRALAIRAKAQGPDHPDTAETLMLAATCQLAGEGKADEATLSSIRRAMVAAEKAKGKDDPAVARALHLRATCHMFRREFVEAEADLTRALAILEAARGPDDAKVAGLLDDLGDVHAVQADPVSPEAIRRVLADDTGRGTSPERHGELAEASYSRALAIRERCLKPDDADLADTLFNLGQLALVRARPAEGERHLARWLALREGAKATATEKDARVLMMLAIASVERKDFAQAEARLSRAQAIVEEIGGAESDDFATLLSMRFDVALQAGSFDVAQRLLARRLEFHATRLGPDDPDVARARALVAFGYGDHAQDRSAAAHWRRIGDLAREIGDEPGRAELAATLRDYAALLRRTNRVVPRATEEDLTYLKASGAVMPSTTLVDLETVESLMECRLTDEGLGHAGRLHGLQELAADRDVTDRGLASVKGLVGLRSLDLFSTGVTDAGMAELSGLAGLEVVNLAHTRVTDAGLVPLRGLKRLRELDLRSTAISDVGLATLAGLEGLRKLDVQGNVAITEAGVKRLLRANPALSIEYTREGGVPPAASRGHEEPCQHVRESGGCGRSRNARAMSFQSTGPARPLSRSRNSLDTSATIGSSGDE